MSLCTTHERTTVPGVRGFRRLRRRLLGRKCGGCSSRPTGSGGKRPAWAGGFATAGAMSCWARTGCVSRNGNEAGLLTTVKSGPHRIVYCVRLPEATIYIKHFLVPNRRAMLRQWVRRGKGRNEGKRSVAAGHDRSADDHSRCTRRAAEAKVLVRELPGHTGDFRHNSARRVRRVPPAGVARAGAVDASAGNSPGPSP